ncbi:DNA alkylation repair protein [Planctomycetota bacterium]
MATILKKHYRHLNLDWFLELVFDGTFEKKELKERMRHTTLALHSTFPKDYAKAVAILKKAAPEVKGFEAMCLPDYVEVYGQDDWDLSLEAMAVFTQYSSSEFAIRPYLQKDPKRGMAYMLKLTGHKEANVRRFASEGCRPRLPWAMALPVFKKDPTLILPILEKLKDDESEFVRKSVGNNLNDISKDNPKVVLDLCKKWQGQSPCTDWIIKHACRTLLKAGSTQALRLFGFGDPKAIDIKAFKLEEKQLHIGDDLHFSFKVEVNTKKPTKLRLEYRITFAKAKGKTSQKVFQIKEGSFDPGTQTIKRKQSFANMSTRKHYPGDHHIAIIVNGVEKVKKSFAVLSS